MLSQTAEFREASRHTRARMVPFHRETSGRYFTEANRVKWFRKNRIIRVLVEQFEHRLAPLFLDHSVSISRTGVYPTVRATLCSPFSPLDLFLIARNAQRANYDEKHLTSHSARHLCRGDRRFRDQLRRPRSPKRAPRWKWSAKGRQNRKNVSPTYI